jgi:hypothetical protein
MAIQFSLFFVLKGGMAIEILQFDIGILLADSESLMLQLKI